MARVRRSPSGLSREPIIAATPETETTELAAATVDTDVKTTSTRKSTKTTGRKATTKPEEGAD